MSARNPERRATPELQLLIDCCKAAFRKSSPRPSAGDGLNWQRVVRLARFHRVSGLVWHQVRKLEGTLPAEAESALSSDAAAVAELNLRGAAQSRELLRDLDASEIPARFIKGLTLGQLAYRNILLKAGIDIDLLVNPEHISAAAEILRKRGYILSIPAEATAGGLERWHRSHKESLWIKPGSQLQIDLHSRLSDNPDLISSIGMRSPTQLVQVCNGVVLPTLAEEELLTYLAVHGASTAWFRLKWISDFAALMDGRSPTEILQFYERSQELGAGRASAQALLLADELFETLRECQSLRNSLLRQPANRRLFRLAMSQLSAEADPVEPTSTFLGTMPLHRSKLLLAPGLRSKISEMWRQARSAIG